MLLFLVQHGEARPEEEDPARPLTERGRQEVEQVARFLLGRAAPSRVLHSGKLRARQTAEILAGVLASGASPEQVDGLEPMADPGIWARRAAEAEEALMLVGHLPHLERLASLLITGGEGARPVAFRTGGVVCLEKWERGWSLRWAITPDLLSGPARG